MKARASYWGRAIRICSFREVTAISPSGLTVFGRFCFDEERLA